MILCTSCSNTIHYRQWFECGRTNTTALRCIMMEMGRQWHHSRARYFQIAILSHDRQCNEMGRRLLHSSPQPLVSLRKHCSLVWHVYVFVDILLPQHPWVPHDIVDNSKLFFCNVLHAILLLAKVYDWSEMVVCISFLVIAFPSACMLLQHIKKQSPNHFCITTINVVVVVVITVIIIIKTMFTNFLHHQQLTWSNV